MKQFVSAVPPDANGKIKISGKDFHYLVEVRREEENAGLRVRFPDGTVRRCTVERIDRNAKTAFLVAAPAFGDSPVQPDAPRWPEGDVAAAFPRILLFQWILKTRAMDLVVRQAVETGVAAIIPVAGERCVSSFPPGAENPRWTRIIREAKQQSGSPVATRILPVASPGDIPRILQEHAADVPAIKIVLSEIPGGGRTAHECVAAQNPPDAAEASVCAALAVGPEGGMTSQEMENLETSGFEKIHFDTNVLRAETAALYGLAAIQTSIMERAKWQLKE